MYIGKSACISYQPTIAEGPVSLTPLREMESIEIQAPEYKSRLKPGLLRRMSGVLKMGTYTAMQCLDNEKQPEAIVVGTGLGCVRDTISFLEQTISNNEQTLAPTAFIQSTHNSIGGQIALMLQNYSYNMTMVQNSVSFEMALLDAQLQLETENLNQVLVGGVDELTPALQELLQNLASTMGSTLPTLGEGSAFFNITPRPGKHTRARITNIQTRQNFQGDFLEETGLKPTGYDLILHDGFSNLMVTENTTLINFKAYCGEYFTASAFALHLGLEAISNTISEIGAAHSVLILNKFGNNYGAIALERFDV